MTFLEVAQELASARVAWATDFLLYRTMHTKSDGQAKAMADERNIERLTMAEARYELAKWRLREDDYAATTTPAITVPSHPDGQPEASTTDEEGAGQDCGE